VLLLLLTPSKLCRASLQRSIGFFNDEQNSTLPRRMVTLRDNSSHLIHSSSTYTESVSTDVTTTPMARPATIRRQHQIQEVESRKQLSC
jgi:hypothetical protein